MDPSQFKGLQMQRPAEDDAAAPGGENPEGAQAFKDKYTDNVKSDIEKRREKKQQIRQQRRNSQQNFRDQRQGMQADYRAKRREMRESGASREDMRAERQNYENRRKSHAKQHRDHRYGQRMQYKHFNAPEEGTMHTQAQVRYKDNQTGREFNVNHGGYTPKDEERFTRM